MESIVKELIENYKGQIIDKHSVLIQYQSKSILLEIDQRPSMSTKQPDISYYLQRDKFRGRFLKRESRTIDKQKFYLIYSSKGLNGLQIDLHLERVIKNLEQLIG